MGKSSTVYLIISYGFSIAMFDYRIVILWPTWIYEEMVGRCQRRSRSSIPLFFSFHFSSFTGDMFKASFELHSLGDSELDNLPCDTPDFIMGIKTWYIKPC